MSRWDLHCSRLFWLVAFCLGLTGCAGMESRKRLEALELSQTTYNSALRWGRYEDAAEYRVPRFKPPSPLDLDQLDHIRVVSYDILGQEVNENQTEAVLTVAIQYYRDDVWTVKSIRNRQLWWYDETQKRWFLDGDLPIFSSDSFNY